MKQLAKNAIALRKLCKKYQTGIILEFEKAFKQHSPACISKKNAKNFSSNLCKTVIGLINRLLKVWNFSGISQEFLSNFSKANFLETFWAMEFQQKLLLKLSTLSFSTVIGKICLLLTATYCVFSLAVWQKSQASRAGR